MPAVHGPERSEERRQERRCVAWVDDDPGVRRFVQLALEDLPIDLHLLPDAAAARQLLRQQPVDLLVTDLMLPGESGLALLESLARTVPAAQAMPRLVVFSARADLAAATELQRWGVWRVLAKPAPLQVLLTCVQDALAPAPAPPDPAQPAHPPPEKSRVVAEFFGGQAALFEAYLASCRQQLPLDLAAGDAALARGDHAALLHLAHNLKSVLRGLGYPAAAGLAATLENILLPGGGIAAPAPAHPETVAAAWMRVRAAVQAGPLGGGGAPRTAGHPTRRS